MLRECRTSGASSLCLLILHKSLPSVTSLRPGSRDHRGWLLLLAGFSSAKNANQPANKQSINLEIILKKKGHHRPSDLAFVLQTL